MDEGLKKMFIKPVSVFDKFDNCSQYAYICVVKILVAALSFKDMMASLIFFKSVIRALHKVVQFWQLRKKLSIDSVSKEQEHNRFNESAKLCLNLCSERWLKPKLNLVNSFIPSG